MISHIHLGTRDIDAAVEFYDKVLLTLGLRRKFIDAKRGWAGWQGLNDRPLFLVGVPENALDHAPGNGQMVALLAPSHDVVETCFRAAIAAGGSDAGQPGPRPQYHSNYYGAYFIDLDGNKVCVCCHAEDGSS